MASLQQNRKSRMISCYLYLIIINRPPAKPAHSKEQEAFFDSTQHNTTQHDTTQYQGPDIHFNFFIAIHDFSSASVVRRGEDPSQTTPTQRTSNNQQPTR
mmetsp:Transcript_13839/g.29101  ORF Transcript_13839/g.29101 Transcript_13839/m.29101 type:complete len:100 (-) Transcript_13839:162-461(-)